MRSIFLLLFLLSCNAHAKDKPLPLTPDKAVALSGKTVAVTRHAKPDFTAMTAGKAAFGLFGAAAMISAGNKLVVDNEIADPADLIEEQLAPAFAKQWGLQLVPAPQRLVGGTKAKDVVAAQAGVDYVLDIRSGGWMYAYYPTDWDTYWVAYSMQIQLIDVASKAVVSNLACNSSTHKHPNSPSREAMLADRAALLKDILVSMGWQCTHLLGKEQFLLPTEALPPIPAQYSDVLAQYAGRRAAPVAAPAATPTESAVAAPAEQAAPVDTTPATEPTTEPAAAPEAQGAHGD